MHHNVTRTQDQVIGGKRRSWTGILAEAVRVQIDLMAEHFGESPSDMYEEFLRELERRLF